MQSLLQRLQKKNDQKGFTLIEMLVVIAILGILAAVVTMSMVGITNTAKAHADSAELQTVQVALDTMAADQQIPAGNFPCSGAATNDMQNFPAPGNGLYPKYIRQQTITSGRTYSCDVDGKVTPH